MNSSWEVSRHWIMTFFRAGRKLKGDLIQLFHFETRLSERLSDLPKITEPGARKSSSQTTFFWLTVQRSYHIRNHRNTPITRGEVQTETDFNSHENLDPFWPAASSTVWRRTVGLGEGLVEERELGLNSRHLLWAFAGVYGGMEASYVPLLP